MAVMVFVPEDVYEMLSKEWLLLTNPQTTEPGRIAAFPVNHKEKPQLPSKGSFWHQGQPPASRSSFHHSSQRGLEHFIFSSIPPPLAFTNMDLQATT